MVFSGNKRSERSNRWTRFNGKSWMSPFMGRLRAAGDPACAPSSLTRVLLGELAHLGHCFPCLREERCKDREDVHHVVGHAQSDIHSSGRCSFREAPGIVEKCLCSTY